MASGLRIFTLEELGSVLDSAESAAEVEKIAEEVARHWKSTRYGKRIALEMAYDAWRAFGSEAT